MATKLQRAKSKASSAYEAVPKEFRVALAVVSGGYLAYWIYKKTRPETDKEKEERQKGAAEGDIKDDIKDLKDKGQKLTYNKGQYSQYANSIYDALNCWSCWDGVEYGVIKNTLLRMKNDLDVATLVDSFGTRTYDTWFTREQTNSLFGFLSTSLDESEKKPINEYWASQKIKYRL